MSMKKCNFDCFSPMFSKRNIAISLAILLVVLVYGCVTALYIPNETQVTANASLKDLNDGRTAYINKCGGCHTLFVPEKYSANEWDKWVTKMESKAKITPLEKEQILNYLTMGKK